jgi:hypothetical protein
MEGCWPVALVALGLPSAAAGFLLPRYPTEWQWILLGWGVGVLVLLAWLAGTDVFIPTGDEFDLFARIRDAFAVVCGPMPFLVGLIGGAGLGYGAHELSKPKV